MFLELLEKTVLVDERVPRVERYDEPDRNEIVGHVIDPRAADAVPFEGISHGVNDAAGLGPSGGHFEDFLNAGLENLIGFAAEESPPSNEFFRQIAARPVSEHGHFRPKVDARFEVALSLAAGVDPLVAGPHSDHSRAFFEDLHAGEAGEHVHAALLDQARAAIS